MQKVKIECSNCEAVDEYEFEGCFIIGIFKDGTLFHKRHEVNISQLAEVLAGPILGPVVSKYIEKGLGESKD